MLVVEADLQKNTCMHTISMRAHINPKQKEKLLFMFGIFQIDSQGWIYISWVFLFMLAQSREGCVQYTLEYWVPHLIDESMLNYYALCSFKE